MKNIAEANLNFHLIRIMLLLISVIPSASDGSDFHWRIDYKESGTYSCSEILSNGRTKKYQNRIQHRQKFGGKGITSIEIQMKEVITSTATWVDNIGKPALHAPADAFFMEKASTECRVTHGLIDSSQSEGEFSSEKFDGKYFHTISNMVIQKAGSSGFIKNSKTISTMIRVIDPTESEFSVDWKYELIPKNRGVMISASIDPTYNRVLVKGVPTRVVNHTDEMGTTKADTIYPGVNGTKVVFKAVPFKIWDSSSDYHWFSALTENWKKGSNGPNNIDVMKINYKNLDQTKAIKDHIFLRVNGKDYMHDLKSNYYLQFHQNGSENWQVTKRILHPIPFVHGAKNPDWGDRFCLFSNGTPLTQSYVIPLLDWNKMPESDTLSINNVSIDSDSTTFKTFQKRLAVTGEAVLTSSISGENVKIVAPPNTTVVVYYAPAWLEMSGTCSDWDEHGYRGDVLWTVIKVPKHNQSLNMSIHFDYIKSPDTEQKPNHRK